MSQRPKESMAWLGLHPMSALDQSLTDMNENQQLNSLNDVEL